jgi:hypothetical protein
LATGVYNRTKYNLGRGLLDLGADDIRVLLVSSAYVFDADDEAVSDVVAAELSGSGYLRFALSGKEVVEDVIGDNALWKANNITWGGASFGTPDSAIFYVEGATDAGRELICCVDLSPKTETNGNSYRITLVDGIMVLE